MNAVRKTSAARFPWRPAKSGLCPAGGTGRNDDVLRDAPVGWHEEEHAVLRVHSSDNALVSALQHLDDLAVRPAAVIFAGDADASAISVEHLAHLRGRQEDALLRITRNEESVTVRMRFDSSFEQRARDFGRSAARGAPDRVPRRVFPRGFEVFFL